MLLKWTLIPQPWLLIPATPLGSRWCMVPATAECRAGGELRRWHMLCSEPLGQAGIHWTKSLPANEENGWGPREHGMVWLSSTQLNSFPSPKMSILTYRCGGRAVPSSRTFWGGLSSSLNRCHRLYKQYECVNVPVFGSWLVPSISGTHLKPMSCSIAWRTGYSWAEQQLAHWEEEMSSFAPPFLVFHCYLGS